MKNCVHEVFRNISRLVILCGVFGVALLCSLFFPVFIYACVLIGLVAVVMLPVNQVFAFLLFVFPYANLIASNVESTSLFLLIEFAAVAMILFFGDKGSESRMMLTSFVVLCKETFVPLFKKETKHLQKGTVRALALILVDTVIGIVGYGLKSISESMLKLLVAMVLIILTSVDKLGDLKYILLLAKILGLFYLFAQHYKKEDAKLYSAFFVVAMLFSSVLGLFKTSIPRLLAFFPDLNYELINGVYVPRFSGINPDPNHYAIPLMLCVAICLFSALRRGVTLKERLPAAVLAVVFVVLGTMTMSKSFLLILIVTGLAAVVAFVPRRILKIAIPALALVVLAVFLIPNPLISNILYRFQNLTDTNVSLLNGREAIWGTYIAEISGSISKFLFGFGLQAPLVNGRASHNIFIEAIYRIGLTGMIIWLWSIASCVWISNNGKKRKVENYWGFVLLVVQYFLLSGLTVYDYAYYLMIACVIYSCNFDKNDSLV